jgi:predicted outer membrane protein
MHATLSRVTTVSLLALSLTVASCKGKDTAATTDTTAATSTAMHDTAMSPTTSTANGAVSATLSDANIVALIDEVNVGDSMLAAGALPKLTDVGARNFAKMMMNEHHALHVKGLALEKAQNITPELPTTDPFKPAVVAEQSALGGAAKGTTFDSTYISNEVGIHQAVIEWTQKNVPQNAALQTYIKDGTAVYQRHLDTARGLLAKLGKGKMS